MVVTGGDLKDFKKLFEKLKKAAYQFDERFICSSFELYDDVRQLRFMTIDPDRRIVSKINLTVVAEMGSKGYRPINVKMALEHFNDLLIRNDKKLYEKLISSNH